MAKKSGKTRKTAKRVRAKAKAAKRRSRKAKPTKAVAKTASRTSVKAKARKRSRPKAKAKAKASKTVARAGKKTVAKKVSSSKRSRRRVRTRTSVVKAKVSRRSRPKAKAKAAKTVAHAKRKHVARKVSSPRHSRPKVKATKIAAKAVAKKVSSSRHSRRKVKTPRITAKARAKSISSKVKAHRRTISTAGTTKAVKAKAERPVVKTKVWKPVAKKASATKVIAKTASTQSVSRKERPVMHRAPHRKVHKPKAAASKPITQPTKTDFDFNKWLLPPLELEQYEPNFVEEPGIEDNIKGSTRYAWIGAGQCGGRVAKSFYDLGYKKVVAVNTTHHDLDGLDIPKAQKYLMDIGEKGAGKDMERGKEAIRQYGQEILHLTRRTFGTKVDHIMVCFGAGGGTGGGSAIGLVEIAKRYARHIGLNNPDRKVGVMMTLPTVGEASSPMVAQNAYDVASKLSELAMNGKISPLIIIDNEKINKLYPGMTVKSFWPTINSTVAGLFDIFNRVSAMSTKYTSFDPVDYHSIMEAGSCAIMGLTKVDKFHDKFAISQGVKKNLERTLLASGFNLTTAKLCGCIVVGGRKMIAEVRGLQDNIDYAFDVLSGITGKATIHRGIYEDDRNSLRVYTIIGGMETPTKRLENLLSYACV